jgi:hypothetical protein
VARNARGENEGDLGKTLREEFRNGIAESRRHSQILLESLQDDIRIVAEGVAGLAAKFGR